jgi:hypothetical protein
MPYKSLTPKRIVEALRLLATLARGEGVTLEVSLYGGAVFTLVYASRETTKDVDAIVRPGGTAKRLALRVAAELSLPEDWLNDDVKQFLGEKEAKRQLTTVDFGPGLSVSVPTATYLLAMKLRACRPPLPGYEGDYADIRFLIREMGLNSLQDAEDIHGKFFPHDSLSLEAREVVRESLGPKT